MLPSSSFGGGGARREHVMMVRLSVGTALCLLLALSVAPAAAPPARLVDRYGDPLPPGAVARLGTSRWSWTDGMRRLFAHPDGKHLLSTDGEGLAFWDLR